MRYQEWIGEVSDRAHMTEDQAELALKAFVQTLSERVSDEEAEDLLSQLPSEATRWYSPSGEVHKYSVDEFLDKVAEREGVDREEAAHHTQAIWGTLKEAVPGAPDHVKAQLPCEYERVLA